MNGREMVSDIAWQRRMGKKNGMIETTTGGHVIFLVGVRLLATPKGVESIRC